jgi:hypothetical protein
MSAYTYGSGVETAATSARPFIGGRSFTARTASSTEPPSATTTPRIAPSSRRCRTSERVSRPVSAGMPRSWSQSVQAGPRASRMTAPRTCTRADSERPFATP